MGWCDGDLQLPPNFKQLDLACPADVKICVRKCRFSAGMPENVADVRVLSDHVFEVILEIQKALLGVEPSEQHMGWLYQVGEGLPQQL